MKRRNFLQATTVLPFFPYATLGKELSGENGVNSENNSNGTPDNDQKEFFYRPVNG